MNNPTEYKKLSQESLKSSGVNNSTKKTFFLPVSDSVRLETPIKDRFKVLLQRIGLSQNEFADEVGTSRATMSHIVNGTWFPSSVLMTKICKKLDVQSHIIFGDSQYWKEYHKGIVYPKEEEE